MNTMTSLQQIKESANESTIVSMRGITKRFPGGVVAVDNVDFELSSGEIHALLGENGAGKTTLMNILYGLYSSDSGHMFVDGRPVSIKSPRDAIQLGIGMVHQNFQLIPRMTVSENIVLGLKSERPPLLELEKASSKIKELSSSYGLRVNPAARVEQLSMGERQKVEIVKALYRKARVLILDEPTSVLTPQEGEELFKLLDSMTEEGKTVVLITHKLPEVMAISQRVTVLRHGKVVANLETKLTSAAELAGYMVGHEISLKEAGKVEASHKERNTLLELKNVSALNDKGLLGVNDLSLSLYEGEILGIAGVAGNGQRELAEVITGLRHVTDGEVLFKGRVVTNGPPSRSIELGIRYIPEDRLGSGVIPDFTIADNLVLERRRKNPFSKNWLLERKAIEDNAAALLSEYDIVAPNPNVTARTLSGGNLQKLILAKVLSGNPKVLVASQPTAGLDVGAAQFIRNKLRQEAARGVGILLISGDLNELISLSDRIAVMYEGKVTGIVPASESEIEEIGLLMGGAGRQA